ncbi:leader peptidase (prepilin peptidase)/N-methyltransferase [Sedimentibacter acidaminivorans]|uniref:Leader peptidase (Prepilin peptidase)/N-methyltransferase n=1 Tax=Sedimentibacter acidaminivorans TaxID=913099 RepID=A0ABS4GGB2_9FIRM|nr:prepilin peptidase [Sedimentibacter acidaminivorans]MBP1926719.1 leader peptidase (prepilin peptidase)/N-methyltransferase [Sedimentibacter acidaminivorans]
MQIIIYIITILMLIKISNIDYKQKIIPDMLSLIIALLGIFNLIINFQNCKVYIASAAIAFAVFLLIAIITGGGIGGGDIKLLTALSLIFGTNILDIVAITFTSATIILIPGLISKRINTKVNLALAPYICFGVIIISMILIWKGQIT